jgi:hypothetical protein
MRAPPQWRAAAHIVTTAWSAMLERRIEDPKIIGLIW